jgi:hypothetical protein
MYETAQPFTEFEWQAVATGLVIQEKTQRRRLPAVGIAPAALVDGEIRQSPVFRSKPLRIEHPSLSVRSFGNSHALRIVQAIPKRAQPIAIETLQDLPDQLVFLSSQRRIRQPAHKRFQLVHGEAQEHVVQHIDGGFGLAGAKQVTGIIADRQLVGGRRYRAALRSDRTGIRAR